MPLIRLECSETSLPEELPASLESARDVFVDANAVDFELEANLCPRLAADLPFFALPEQQLLAYEKHRETSELGHIFRIANGLHDHIDAVVMTGSGGGFLGARAIAAACCDPFHNETTRAARGSKPRIYFAGDDLDNDQLQSLIGRLSAGGYGDGVADRTWAIIAADAAGRSDSPRYVLNHLVETLISNTPSIAPELRARLVTAIGPVHSLSGGPIAQRLASHGFDQSLRVPDSIENRSSVFTPLGLLSSAFLGLDCIQLLVGAAAINENFRKEPFERNLVLRFVAANRAAATGDDRSAECKRLSAWWARSLTGFQDWLQCLHPHHWPIDVATEFGRSVLNEQLESGCLRGEPLVCNHVDVAAIRTDPLPVTPENPLRRGDDSQSVRQTQQHIAATIDQQLADVGIRQNRITLPVLDTHSLGQWMQLMMLAAAIESRLNTDAPSHDTKSIPTDGSANPRM
ncbi:Glucose-6-phosphate isomerase [Stieleria maiorica]|uniref:Glucose-6-phosphate isomerase n=1 Tax=Stieleria maiorica TaxID=2795974 RepID=A0A5B9MAE2_9BACT|nr:hypothetical protein [Stieleria maiorica]QEF98202.1 Glucose-6-phosphate isomerase [Stieleria maiorica]